MNSLLTLFSRWFALGLLLSVALRGQPAVSPNRVTFYSEPNFKGEALVVEAGASIDTLDRYRRANQQPWSFAISSVKIEGTAKATVFSGERFAGERLDISASISDLYAVKRNGDSGANWDRAIGSVTITGPQPTTVVTAPTRPPEPPETVVIVREPERVVVQPPRVRMDLRTADAIINRAYREVLRRNADPDGLRMYRQRLIYEGWNEQQIIQQLQRSSEARAVNPEQAITQAYREVLGRDPDPQGMAHYRAKWRDGWTQGQIRDDLRRSNESRNTHIHSAIVRAYRDLLGRDPDPEGYSHFERAMRERGWTERDVRQNIMNGEEYRNRNGKRR